MMKQLLSLAFTVFVFSTEFCGQQVAVVTETGQEVLLYVDGSWQYNQPIEEDSIQTDTLICSKHKQADFLVKSTKIDVGIWLDKKKWSYSRPKEGTSNAADFVFNLIGQDAYAMLIAERIEIPIDNLLAIAFQNAERAASDARIVKKEARKVNGKVVHFMQMEATIQGIKFVYQGYYYSDANGSVQLLAYTAKNLLKNYEKDFELFLNGFEAF